VRILGNQPHDDRTDAMTHHLTRALANRVLAETSHWWRRALLARSAEASALIAGHRIMVVAPHPDDETFGCGALIARVRAAGDQVTVVVATDGRHSTRSAVLSPDELADLRAGELRAACDGLGVPGEDLVTLGWADGSLAGRTPQVAARLAELIAQRRPEMVFAPCARDEHPDHRAVHRAAVRAVIEQADPCLLVGYPVWTWANAPWLRAAAGSTGPGWRERLSWSARQLITGGWVRVECGPHLAAKRAAVAAYASQTTNLTGEPSWSHLSPEFVALFLQPVEIFQPLLDNRGHGVLLPASRQIGI
jgi:LmbE family N-acetylglucosaminyl deacetylase